MGTLWVVLGIWLVVCGATVGDPVASKSAEALEHYQRGEYDQALQLYRDALLDRPDAPELHFNVGDALFKRGEYDQALREFERVLSAEEKKIQAQAHYNMGNSFFQQQAFEQAVAAYKQALELDAADEDTKVNLELALEKLQEQQQQQEQQDQQDQQDDSEQEQGSAGSTKSTGTAGQFRAGSTGPTAATKSTGSTAGFRARPTAAGTAHRAAVH